jgi:hypothetical protein
VKVEENQAFPVIIRRFGQTIFSCVFGKGRLSDVAEETVK